MQTSSRDRPLFMLFQREYRERCSAYAFIGASLPGFILMLTFARWCELSVVDMAWRLPPRSPNLNAYAERFVRTIKESCLEQMILFGEDALRRAVSQFVAHYHFERNHQALGNRLIIAPATVQAIGRVRRRQRLGGLLNYYHRVAA